MVLFVRVALTRSGQLFTSRSRSLSVPDVARVKAYHTLDVNGFIHVWHHAEGVEPTWTLPEIEQITRGEWSYRGRTEHHVCVHIEVRRALHV